MDLDRNTEKRQSKSKEFKDVPEKNGNNLSGILSLSYIAYIIGETERII